MKTGVTVFALAALASLIGVSAWATAQQPIGAAIADLLAHPHAGSHPWFVATLFDTYFAFLWFWLWVAYRENSVLARLAWLAGILALGNIAMAAYVLLALRRLPPGAGAAALFARRA